MKQAAAAVAMTAELAPRVGELLASEEFLTARETGSTSFAIEEVLLACEPENGQGKGRRGSAFHRDKMGCTECVRTHANIQHPCETSVREVCHGAA